MGSMTCWLLSENLLGISIHYDFFCSGEDTWEGTTDLYIRHKDFSLIDFAKGNSTMFTFIVGDYLVVPVQWTAF